MATTSVSIGPLTYTSPERDNQRASKRVEYYLKAYGLWNEADTNMQRLAKYDDHLHRVHTGNVIRAYILNLRRDEAAVAAQTEIDDVEVN